MDTGGVSYTSCLTTEIYIVNSLECPNLVSVFDYYRLLYLDMALHRFTCWAMCVGRQHPG